MRIGNKDIGPGLPTFLVAEMSANHMQSMDRAKEIIHAAKEAGADAIKVQTFTPDTITFNSRREEFSIKGTDWNGKTLHELYREASLDWDWHAELQREATRLGLEFFSTPFDETAVQFLQSLKVPAFKISSFELVDHPLLEQVAKTGLPVIVSTAMGTLGEIEEAVSVLRSNGCSDIALLKCTMTWPSHADEMHLKTIPHLAETFQVTVGLSDHSLELAVPVAAVALGACIIEKHLTLRRSDGGPDSTFSLEPEEFKQMADAVRVVDAALGRVRYGPNPREQQSRQFRRSLIAVEDIPEGGKLTSLNVRCLRPGHGLAPRHFHDIMGKTATKAISSGTPLSWDLIGK